jgi:hypothetical protein
VLSGTPTNPHQNLAAAAGAAEFCCVLAEEGHTCIGAWEFRVAAPPRLSVVENGRHTHYLADLFWGVPLLFARTVFVLRLLALF